MDTDEHCHHEFIDISRPGQKPLSLSKNFWLKPRKIYKWGNWKLEKMGVKVEDHFDID